MVSFGEQPGQRVGVGPAHQDLEAGAVLDHPDVVDEPLAAAGQAHFGILEGPQDTAVGEQRGALVVGSDDATRFPGEEPVELIRSGRRQAGRIGQCRDRIGPVGAEYERRAQRQHDATPGDEARVPRRRRIAGRLAGCTSSWSHTSNDPPSAAAAITADVCPG